MIVEVRHIPQGHPNRPGIKLEALKALVIHYTQNDNPNANSIFHAKWIARPYIAKVENGKTIYYEIDKITKFRFGSAHIFCDTEKCVEIIPFDEIAWGCGDRSFNGGYKPVAYNIFNSRQNLQTISIEICNNDTIKNSDADWKQACNNAISFIQLFLKNRNLKIDIDASLNPQNINKCNGILLLRHFDITGKLCPEPFVSNKIAWENFVYAASRG